MAKNHNNSTYASHCSRVNFVFHEYQKHTAIQTFAEMREREREREREVLEIARQCLQPRETWQISTPKAAAQGIDMSLLLQNPLPHRYNCPATGERKQVPELWPFAPQFLTMQVKTTSSTNFSGWKTQTCKSSTVVTVGGYGNKYLWVQGCNTLRLWDAPNIRSSFSLWLLRNFDSKLASPVRPKCIYCCFLWWPWCKRQSVTQISKLYTWRQA